MLVLPKRAPIIMISILSQRCRFIPPTIASPKPKHSKPSTLSLPFPFRFTTHRPSQLTSNTMTEPAPASATQQNSAASESGNDVLVQYVVLRRDLIDTWPLGSVVTQGCHASVAAIWSNKDDSCTAQYCSPENIDSMHKVTLEVKGEPQIKNLSEKLTAAGITHKLWVEQPEDFPTCLATKPYPKSVVSAFFKKLKLCK